MAVPGREVDSREETAAPRRDERRVIAHCDIDAFYASVELLRHPELRGKPLVVAGSGPRSVVTTASYEARRFGIDSAMPAARARALCPHAVFIPPDHAAYRAKSQELWALVRERVERVQQVGVDEAYLDITSWERPMPKLRELIAEVEASTGLVVSIGVGPSRLVAKTVSAHFKPRALRALSREDACGFFGPRPVRILQGVGPRTAERLAAMGIETVAALQQADPERLRARFGANLGRFLASRAHFHDDSVVAGPRPAKSQSNERTFEQDIADPAELERMLARLGEGLCQSLRRKELRGRNVAIKVRLDDWTTVTRARTLPERTDDPLVVVTTALELLRAYGPARPVRLLGVRVGAFEDPAPARLRGRPLDQLELPLSASFPAHETGDCEVGI